MPVTIHDKQDGTYDFLKNHKVGVLATVDPSGAPHAAAVYFTVDNELNISFLTKTRTKKSDNLQHNKQAVMVIFEPESQTTVQLTGTVSQITDMDETNAVFTQVIYASLDESESPVPPISRLREGDYIAYKLKPDQVRMAVFKRPEFGNYDELFTTIVPNA